MTTMLPNIQDDSLPDDVYHYTDATGLLGILENQSLRATHAAYLNDSQEIIHGTKMIRQVADDIARSLPDEVRQAFPNPDGGIMKGLLINFMTIITLKMLPGELKKQTESLLARFGPFVTCLSAEGDLLSQWRGYGRGGGYAIRFDGRELQSSVTRLSPDNREDRLSESTAPGHMLLNSRRFIKMRYEDDEQKAVARQQIIDLLVELTKLLAETGQREVRQIVEDDLKNPRTILSWLLSISMRVKHHGFNEEKEYRILTFALPDCFTPAGHGLIPRTSIHFSPSSVKEILIGPGQDMEMRKSSIEYYTTARPQYSHVEVERSAIPFRGT